MATWGPEWFNCSRLTFILGLCLFNFSVAITPMFLAPLSEILGRNIIYQVAGWIVALLFLPQIFSHNIHGYLAARWFVSAPAGAADGSKGWRRPSATRWSAAPSPTSLGTRSAGS
jgi:hypothetical protein